MKFTNRSRNHKQQQKNAKWRKSLKIRIYHTISVQIRIFHKERNKLFIYIIKLVLTLVMFRFAYSVCFKFVLFCEILLLLLLYWVSWYLFIYFFLLFLSWFRLLFSYVFASNFQLYTLFLSTVLLLLLLLLSFEWNVFIGYFFVVILLLVIQFCVPLFLYFQCYGFLFCFFLFFLCFLSRISFTFCFTNWNNRIINNFILKYVDVNELTDFFFQYSTQYTFVYTHSRTHTHTNDIYE